MQTISDLSMDKVDEKSIELLLNAGDKMWQENKRMVKRMIRKICDEKFGGLQSASSATTTSSAGQSTPAPTAADPEDEDDDI